MKTLQLRNNPAYNEGNLLGHQVTNGVFGAVPLTFTRNSNGYILDTNGDKLRGANVPRIKSDGSVLLEPARTNLLTYSEQFDNAAWVNANATITPNATTAPDGTITADLVTATSTNGIVTQFNKWSTTTSTGSVYAKKGTSDTIAIDNATTIGSGVIFNISNGTIVSEQSGFVGKIEDVGNGWYRCSVVHTAAALNSFAIVIPTNGTTAYLWGAQVEVGSYPSSYIPTTSSTITRVAESVSRTGIANLIGQSEGTIFFEGSKQELIAQDITIGDGTSGTNNVLIQFRTDGTLYYSVAVGGVSQCLISGGSYSVNQNIKIAARYKENDFALYANGVKIGNDANGLTFGSNVLNRLYFGRNDGATRLFYGEIKQLALYTTALTDDELYNLTK